MPAPAEYQAISLWQPYASIIAAGVKPYETRDWAPPSRMLGSRVAIHAAKKVEVTSDLPPAQARAISEAVGTSEWDTLPRGAVVCTAVLSGCYKLGHVVDGHAKVVDSLRGSPHKQDVPVDPYGNFSPGRWVWLLTDIEKIEPPVPVRGQRSWWTWSPGQ